MLDAILDVLAWLGRYSDPLAWVVVATFAAGVLAERYDRDRARYVVAGAWVLFGVFWLTLIHYYAFEQKSIVEGIGSVVAVPASVYVGHRLLSGRDSLFVLARAVAVMGLVFLPFETIPVLRQLLIEAVTDQTAFLMSLLGYHPEVVAGMTFDGRPIPGKVYPYESTFLFYQDGHPILYTIRIACTGLGSMVIFAGLIAAVRAPLSRKLSGLAVTLPIIYVLNLFRNVFIGLSFGNGYAHVFPDLVMTAFATSDPYMVSYYVADRIVAQFLSVVVLVGLTWLLVRRVPEVLVVVEDLLFLATGSEYDLRAALSVEVDPVRADGEG